MFDVIVLGATFAAAGIAGGLKERCLILERGTTAGNEFFEALHFGKDYEIPAETARGQQFQQAFLERGVFSQDRTCVYECRRILYQLLKETNIRFSAEVIDIQKVEDYFVCKTYEVDGYHTYTAKNVVDTRSKSEISTSKTYNFLIESVDAPVFSGICAEKWGYENQYVLKCPVPLSCGYEKARELVRDVIGQFDETQKLVLLANGFDYQIRPDLPEQEAGVFLLPSKQYRNPVLAYDAGVCFGEGM